MEKKSSKGKHFFLMFSLGNKKKERKEMLKFFKNLKKNKKENYFISFHYSLFQPENSHTETGFGNIELELEKNFSIREVENLIEKNFFEKKGQKSRVIILAFEKKTK